LKKERIIANNKILQLTMKKIIIVLLFCVSQLSHAQDFVKLYVLYDVSGSTRVADLHENLRALTRVLLREDNDSAQSPISIELITFGEDIKEQSLNLYQQSNIARSRSNLPKFLNNISSRANNNQVERYTHLLKALEEINAYSPESFGVFIFADGLLGETDVDAKKWDVNTYCDKIRANIRLLQSNSKPVFLVQSSTYMTNDYYDIPKTFFSRSDSLNVSADFFWLRSDINYKEIKGTNNSITKAFNKFLLQAFFRIQNKTEDINTNDPIAQLLTLAEWLRLFEITELKQFQVNVKKDKGPTLDSILTKSFQTPVIINPVEKPTVIEKDIKMNDSDTSKGKSRGGVKGYSAFPKDFDLSQLPTQTTYKDILIDVGEKLKTIKSLSAKELDTLYQDMHKLVNDPAFKRLGAELKKYKSNNQETMTLIAQNKKLELPNFAVANKAAQLYNSPLPADNKQRNLQEAIILGLTDYLIKRTKQEALFLSLEQINKNVFAPSSYIRDTLLYHTAKLFETLDPDNDSHFEPNIVLIKEAFNQDMDLITTSLMKHPKVRASNGLVSLLYAGELINNLLKGNTLEGSFEETLSKLPLDSISSSPLERGLLFTCHLISYLEQHDLASLYEQNSTETLSDFSKILAIHIAKQYKDIHQINDLDGMAEKIKATYFQYQRLRGHLEQYKKEVNSLNPTGSFTEYQQYKRQLTLQILKECGELLLTGVDIAEHFVNINSGELKQNITSIRTVSTTALECLFLIQDRKYAEVASHLIPMIPKLSIVRIDSTEEFLSRFSNLRSSFNVVALRNDVASIEKALKNESVDFTKKMYVTFSKEDAVKFLIQNQLSFLSPLLLHERDSLISSTKKLSIWEIKLPEGLSIKDVLKIYESALSDFSDNSFKVKNLFSKIKRKEIKDKWSNAAKVHVARQLLSYFSIDGIDENLKKMIAIAGEISTATTAHEVENVIDKYVLPVASYRIKRTTVHSWMVNAYVGGGGTWYQKHDTVGFALNAPVGVEHSWRFKNHAGCFSLFASLIDVGNVINYRLNQAEKSEKTFLLENVISPGLYAVLGLSKRFPLSLGLGYQLNPQRANVFIAFDLPLFRLK
jgi:hypothetical protein